MNKDSLDKFFQESSEQEIIEAIKISLLCMARAFNSRIKASEISLNTNKAYRGVRGGARSKIEAKHQLACEFYEKSRKDFFQIVEEFKKRY